jgi:DMSO/TMAO reductase YedYZ molybdopterin-dependent catalytic subunit
MTKEQRHRAGVGTIDMDLGLVIKFPNDAALESFVTPAGEHYVLAHHGIARCSPETWTLTVDGLVERELHLTLEQLQSRPQRAVTSFLECVGNPLDADKPTRIVSNATWTGVPLSTLLREAGVTKNAAYVWLHGEDWGQFAGTDHDAYVRDLPLAKALEDDVLVAGEMNGAPLTPEHGFPLRVIVPGYYGTNSVKWLSRISLRAERPAGFYTDLYDQALGKPGVPAWNVRVNSRITRPADREVLERGRHEIRGWAWGDEPVARVEVSTDGGTSWRLAELDSRPSGRPWQAFRYIWKATESGEHLVIARAYDATGACQPDELHINQIHRVRALVAA